MKYKVKAKNSQLFIKVKTSSKEEKSENELNVLTTRNIRGLFKPVRVKKAMMEYAGPAGISLFQRLQAPVGKYEFFFIMAQISDISRKLRNNNLFLNNLILDLRYVFINEATKEIQFIYVPVIRQHVHADMIGFMESVAYMAKPTTESNTDYIPKFITFLRGLSQFDANQILSYIAKEDRGVEEQIRRNNIGQSGFITNKQKEYYDHYTEHVDPYEETGRLFYNNDMTGMEGTVILNNSDDTDRLDDIDGTTLLEQGSAFVTYATLTRVQTKEEISVNKPVFRIGKEQSYVDYFVSNNNAVSRSHADIIVRDGRCFIKDLNSKNRTFIDGRAITPEREVEVFNGNHIKLANEEFIIHI